jgi:hypothetical protein
VPSVEPGLQWHHWPGPFKTPWLVGERNDGCFSNGDQVSRVTAPALKRGKSVDFTGY